MVVGAPPFKPGGTAISLALGWAGGVCAGVDFLDLVPGGTGLAGFPLVRPAEDGTHWCTLFKKVQVHSASGLYARACERNVNPPTSHHHHHHAFSLKCSRTHARFLS